METESGVEARTILSLNAYDPARDGGAVDGLVARHIANFGKGAVLFYRHPIHMVEGRGVWLTDADGRRYLDAYNNVPSVGHCHPKVVEAIGRQAGRLVIHSRYLCEELERYAERLKATLPADLSSLVLTCSGSEANDLALRLARGGTGATGVVVTEAAYHGNTDAVNAISPATLRGMAPPAHVRTVPAPDPQRFGADPAAGFAAAVQAAIADLRASGHGISALVCDTVFSSDGIYADPPGFLAPAVAAVRAAGGWFIADEVQPGFGRTGAGMWGFSRHGLVPDIVTMGKPMGNGFPMAGLATRPAVLDAFAEQVGYFNTFAASPLAAAAGLAVLDVIEDEGLIDNAARVGVYLVERLRDLATRRPMVAAVRGAGLFVGVDLRADGDPDRPVPEATSRVIEAMREAGVLVGATGIQASALKIRPPLCFSAENADTLVDALARALEGPLAGIG